MTQRAALALTGLLLLLPAEPDPAAAAPSVRVSTSYYSVAGTTAAELKAQMRSLGPNGFWAYTRWVVRWTDSCQVSLEISYTFPRWTNEAGAPPALRTEWRGMLAHLKAHEQQHGQHGRNAAREVEQSHCRGDSRAIVARWSEQDRVYDAQTNHGRTQGVELP